MELKIKFTKKEYAKLYKKLYATDGSSGIDLRSVEGSIEDRALLYPGNIKEFRTGICIEPQKTEFGWSTYDFTGKLLIEGQIRGKSGLAFKHNIFVAHIGTIDNDYRGEIRVLLENRNVDNEDPGNVYAIAYGDAIAQLILCPVIRPTKISIVEELGITKRGKGGFGSTGK